MVIGDNSFEGIEGALRGTLVCDEAKDTRSESCVILMGYDHSKNEGFGRFRVEVFGRKSGREDHRFYFAKGLGPTFGGSLDILNEKLLETGRERWDDGKFGLRKKEGNMSLWMSHNYGLLSRITNSGSVNMSVISFSEPPEIEKSFIYCLDKVLFGVKKETFAKGLEYIEALDMDVKMLDYMAFGDK